MTYYPPRPTDNSARNRLVAIIIGVVFALVVLAALLSGGDGGYSDNGYSDNGYSDNGYTEGSGGSSQTYGDSGSITTGEGGELIYSDSNGNGFSTGG